ncbi:MAG TPA: hypothetical protein VIL35_12960 [Vicinamibacterales bacterium]
MASNSAPRGGRDGETNRETPTAGISNPAPTPEQGAESGGRGPIVAGSEAREASSAGDGGTQPGAGASAAGGSTAGSSPGTQGAHDTRHGIKGIASKIRETAASQLDAQKHRASEGLGGVASAVRKASDQLEQGGHGAVAQYGRKAAEQIERFSHTIEDRDLDQILQDVERFARNQPAIFLGMAFGLGVAAGRFLRASGRGRGQHARPQGGSMGSGYAHAGATGSTSATGATPSTGSTGPSWNPGQAVS